MSAKVNAKNKIEVSLPGAALATWDQGIQVIPGDTPEFIAMVEATIGGFGEWPAGCKYKTPGRAEVIRRGLGRSYGVELTREEALEFITFLNYMDADGGGADYEAIAEQRKRDKVIQEIREALANLEPA